MHKKPIIVCLTVAAFMAFIAVPAASASPVLTHPTGTILSAAGNPKLTATSVGSVTFTSSSGSIHCSHASMTGELTANTGSLIEGKITSAEVGGIAAGTDCESWNGDTHMTLNASAAAPWCMKSGGKDTITIADCAGGSITFTIDFTNGVTCGYGKAAINGTFTTDASGDAVLTVSEQGFSRIHSNSILCLSEVKLDMSLTLETDTTSSNDPLYIS